MKLYIAGPMRGYPRFNFPAFDAAADLIAGAGYEPLNPAAHDRDIWPRLTEWAGYLMGDIDQCPEFDYHSSMSWDTAQIAAGDGIALLPGWEKSTGAWWERQVARACGKVVLYVDPEGKYFGPTPHRRLVGFTGFARAGKDTAADALIRRGWVPLPFAAPLKFMALKLGWTGEKDDTGRRLLQNLGGGVRGVVAEDAWVRALERVWRSASGDVVVPDVRYLNEAAWIHDLGGQVFRVTREGVGPANEHASEHEQLRIDCPTLTNDGTVDDLHAAVLAATE